MKTIFNLTPKDIENSAKWEYNSFFLETIIPALDYMIKEGHGHPSKMTAEGWDNILIEIKEGFEILKKKYGEDGGWSFLKDLNKNDRTKIDRSFVSLKEHFFN